jgi:spore coat protein U-like protein
MFKRKQITFLAAALASTAICGSAFAATATQNLTVQASIASECIVAAPGVFNFGAYSPINANNTTALNGSGNLSVTCTTGSTTPTITLGEGLNPFSAAPTTPLRQMASGASRLAYFLYLDAGRTTAWGNTPGTGRLVTEVNGTPSIETIYGKVTEGQNLPMGTYLDTVVVTVTF